MKTSIALKTLLGAAALTLPLIASAESNVQTGAATSSPGATAHVDFAIVIPKILYLRVGTGSAYTTGALTSVNTIDLITFSPAAGTWATARRSPVPAAILRAASKPRPSSATAATSR